MVDLGVGQYRRDRRTVRRIADKGIGHRHADTDALARIRNADKAGIERTGTNADLGLLVGEDADIARRVTGVAGDRRTVDVGLDAVGDLRDRYRRRGLDAAVRGPGRNRHREAERRALTTSQRLHRGLIGRDGRLPDLRSRHVVAGRHRDRAGDGNGIVGARRTLRQRRRAARRIDDGVVQRLDGDVVIAARRVADASAGNPCGGGNGREVDRRAAGTGDNVAAVHGSGDLVRQIVDRNGGVEQERDACIDEERRGLGQEVGVGRRSLEKFRRLSRIGNVVGGLRGHRHRCHAADRQRRHRKIERAQTGDHRRRQVGIVGGRTGCRQLRGVIADKRPGVQRSGYQRRDHAHAGRGGRADAAGDIEGRDVLLGIDRDEGGRNLRQIADRGGRRVVDFKNRGHAVEAEAGALARGRRHRIDEVAGVRGDGKFADRRHLRAGTDASDRVAMEDIDVGRAADRGPLGRGRIGAEQLQPREIAADIDAGIGGGGGDLNIAGPGIRLRRAGERHRQCRRPTRPGCRYAGT